MSHLTFLLFPWDSSPLRSVLECYNAFAINGVLFDSTRRSDGQGSAYCSASSHAGPDHASINTQSREGCYISQNAPIQTRTLLLLYNPYHLTAVYFLKVHFDDKIWYAS